MKRCGIVFVMLLAATAGGCGSKAAKSSYRSSSPTKPVEVILAKDLGLRMIRLEPGKFLMGSPREESDRSGDEALREVVLEVGFSLGVTEVTQAQYERLIGTNPSEFVDKDRPVESLSWYDAVAFCRELTENERVARNLPKGMVYRLPTEAEWEYACRAGTLSAYCYGDNKVGLVGHAWYRKNSGYTSHVVGTRKPNAWGFHDMHGNVWEWCYDLYGDYGDGIEGKGSTRVRRGGSWNESGRNCRSAKRLWWLPSRRFNDLGFRVALGQELE